MNACAHSNLSHFVPAFLLIPAGLLAPATSRQLQQTAASGPRHRRSLQQIGTAPNLLVATAPAAIQPAVTDAAAVPAVQLPTLPGQQPAGTAVAIPVSINSTASTTTTPNSNVATLGTSNSTNPTAVPTAAAPGVVAPNIANSTVPAATLQPQAPPGFLPPGFGPAAVQQQVQQGATNMDPASGSLAASPLATPAVPATAGTVSTAAAGMTAVAPPAAEQSAWSAGIEQEAAVQQEAGIAVQEQPLSGVQEAAELTPGAGLGCGNLWCTILLNSMCVPRSQSHRLTYVKDGELVVMIIQAGYAIGLRPLAPHFKFTK